MINKWQKWQQCHHLFVFLSDCYSCSRVKSSDARNWISIHTNLWDRKSGGSFHFLFHFHFLCACHWWILGAERRSSFSIFFFFVNILFQTGAMIIQRRQLPINVSICVCFGSLKNNHIKVRLNSLGARISNQVASHLHHILSTWPLNSS